jgi:hypothetical protein
VLPNRWNQATRSKILRKLQGAPCCQNWVQYSRVGTGEQDGRDQSSSSAVLHVATNEYGADVTLKRRIVFGKRQIKRLKLGVYAGF